MEKELTSDEWKEGLMLMAERAVTIPEGEIRGRWDRKRRVMLVYSVLCSLARKAGAPIDMAEEMSATDSQALHEATSKLQ